MELEKAIKYDYGCNFIGPDKMRYVRIAVLTLLISCFYAGKQQCFSRIRVNQGLSPSKVSYILTDQQGALWIKTDDGIRRYDDHYITIFRENRVILIAPFWRTWWFWLLIGSLCASIVYYVYCQRMSLLRERGKIRNEIARDLHDQVGSTLSSIAVYANVAKIYFQKQQGSQLNEVLNNITESAKEMVSDMDDIVWALNPKNDDINSITKRLEAYAHPLCNASDIRFKLIVNGRIGTVHLGMQERKNLYLMVKEAINNAIKYSQCTQLMVKMSLLEPGLMTEVCDNGVGFDMEALQTNQNKAFQGNGLANMHVRARELQARLSIESSLGIGTLVKIVMDDHLLRAKLH